MFQHSQQRSSDMISRDYSFKLDDDEYDRLEAWYNDLLSRHNSSGYFGACGGGLTFKIVPTSIGDVVTAECLGEEFTVRGF